MGESPWELSWRADPRAAALADRHYNRQAIGAAQFVPPGRCLVLRAPNALWVTSWPLAEHVKHAWPGVWINSTFRREGGDMAASEMIRWAVAHTLWKWTPPELGMVTFVDPTKVEHKRQPGRCYLKAGFSRVGTTAGGLLAFQMLPDDMPAPAMPRLAQDELEYA